MSAPSKKWFYFITDKNNKTASVKYTSAGVPYVSMDAMPTPLPQHPTGWKDLSIQFATNLKYWSLNRSFSVPLKFVNEGAQILRHYAYRGKGYEEELYVMIMKWNSEFVAPDGKEGRFELEYRGKIDFSKMNDDPLVGFTVNTIEGGLLSYLNAYDNTTYEVKLDATNPDAIKVLFDGIKLFDKFNFSIIKLEVNFSGFVAIPAIYINNEGDSIGIVKGDQSYEDIAGSLKDYLQNSANYLFYSSTPVSVRIKGKITLKNAGGSGANQFSAAFSTSLIRDFVVIPVLTMIPAGTTSTFDFDVTISLSVNEKLFFIFANPGFNATIEFVQSEFFIEFKTLNPPSTAFALRPLQLLRQLVGLMSDGRYTADSVFFAAHDNIVCTSGEALRQLPNAVLKTSFQDFFSSYNSLYNLGIKVVDDVLWIEPKGDLYNDNSVLFDLGEVSDLKIKIATEYLVNKIKTGYPVQNYDERNGKYEFNDTAEWKLDVTSVQNELNLVSKYRGDGYGIEFIRGKLNNKDTTDNKGDNEGFLVNIDNTTALGSFEAKRETEQIYVDSSLIEYPISSGINISVNNFKTSLTSEVQDPAVDIVVRVIPKSSSNAVIIIELMKNGVVIGMDQQVANGFTEIKIALTTDLNIGDVITVAITDTVPESFSVLTSSINIQFSAASGLLYKLKRETYNPSPPAGVPTDSVFNIEEMTTDRMLRTHGNYIRSLMFQLQQTKVQFQTSDKNKDLSTTLAGVTYTKKADIPISKLANPLFLPYVFEFKLKTPYRFSKVLSAIVAGNITFTFNGYRLYCLPIGDMDAKPVNEEPMEWKLLASPLNNLETLFKLSSDGLFITDYMNNNLFISDINPVHWVKYNHAIHAKYHHKDIHDDWVHNRNERFAVQPAYLQKWQKTDTIRLQFINAGMGALELRIYDSLAQEVGIKPLDIVANTAVQLPYVLNQLEFDLADFPSDNYLFVLYAAGVPIAISEWQKVDTDLDETYLFEYYHTGNKQNAYFSSWRPMIRVEAFKETWEPESTSTEYTDESDNSELLHGVPSKKRKLFLGGGRGIPDWMALKLNQILLLNRVFIDGIRYTKADDSKLEPVKRVGYPFHYYSVDLKLAINQQGLSISDVALPPLTEGGVVYTLDAEAFGRASGIINIEVDE